MRKLIWCFVSVLLLVVLVAGCSGGSSQSSSDTINLTFWTGFSGDDGDFMREMINKFNEEHEEYNVEFIIYDASEYYTRLRTGLSTGEEGPDIASGHLTRLASLLPLGYFTSLNDLAEEAGVDWGTYDQNLLNQTIIDGEHFAIPLDVHAQVMYYNKAILRDIGLLDDNEQPIIEPGPEGFMSFLNKIKENTADDIMPFATNSVNLAPYWMWWGLYSQIGGELISEDGQSVAFDNAEALKALQYMYDMIYVEEVWPRNLQTASDMFLNNRAAVHFNGVWATGFMEKNEDLEFGVMTIPQIFNEQRTWGDSHILLVPEKEDKEKMVAATYFADWLADNTALWSQAGHVPSKPAVLETEQFQSLAYRSDYVEVVDMVSYMPHTQHLQGIQDILLSNINALMAGQVTPEEMLEEAVQDVTELLNR